MKPSLSLHTVGGGLAGHLWHIPPCIACYTEVFTNNTFLLRERPPCSQHNSSACSPLWCASGRSLFDLLSALWCFLFFYMKEGKTFLCLSCVLVLFYFKFILSYWKSHYIYVCVYHRLLLGTATLLLILVQHLNNQRQKDASQSHERWCKVCAIYCVVCLSSVGKLSSFYELYLKWKLYLYDELYLV